MLPLQFVSREELAPDIFSFTFTSPTPLAWIAGQSIRLELSGFYGPEERRFTIASPPSEQQIVITTRISRSTFKQALLALQPGNEVKGYDIRGDFVWQEGMQPKIFLASGIAVTPFHSILAERVRQGLTIPATLLHASRTPVYHQELTKYVQTFSIHNESF